MDITKFIKDVVKADDSDLADIDELDFSDLDIDVEEVVEWLDKKYGDKDLEEIRSVWLDGGITADTSFVDNPAQWSEILAFKDESDRKNLEPETPIKSAEKDFDFNDEDDDRMMTIAPVLVPEVDKEGELIPPQLTEKMIDDYMQNIDERQNNVSFDHDGDSGKGEVARVWTTLEEREFENVNGETITYPESTAIFGIKHNSELDEQTVKNGDIEGLSMEGYKIPVDPEELRKKLKDSQDETKSMSEKSEDEQDGGNDGQELRKEDIKEITDKEINANDLIGLLADFMNVESSEVSEALDPLLNGDEDDGDEDDDEQDAEQSEEIDFNDVEAIQELQKEIEGLKSKIESSEEVEKEDDEDEDDEEDDEDEESYKEDDDPCWDGYTMIGTDDNGDPVCVEEDKSAEVYEMIKEEFKTDPEQSEKDADDEQVEDEQKQQSEDDTQQTEKSEDTIDKVFRRQATETQKTANEIEDEITEEVEKSEDAEDGVEEKDQSDDPIDDVL